MMRAPTTLSLSALLLALLSAPYGATEPASPAAPARPAKPGVSGYSGEHGLFGTPASRAKHVAARAEAVRSILREALGRGAAFEHLSELCRVAPHRLSGSPGGAAAVEWARQRMLALGFENVRLEPVRVPHWVRGERAELHVASPAGQAATPLPILALGGSEPTPEHGITAGLIVVASFDELKARAAEARGKVVLFNHPMDASSFNTFDAYGQAVTYRVRGAGAASKAGARAALVRSMTTRLDDVPHTGGMHYPEGVERIPTAAISTLGAERLARLVEAYPDLQVHLELDCHWLPEATSHNVIGEYVGRERPDEIVVVGGHLDGWDVGQGAHDDGAGCAQSLEVVRLLRALELRPRRTIRVVLFANEENGLAGGNAYRDGHLDELDRHVLALESDSGGFAPRGFTTNGDEAVLDTLARIVALMEGTGVDYAIPGGGGADVGPLVAHGVPVAGLRNDSARYFDLHHSERDTLAQVSPRELNLGAGAMAALAYVVADLEEALPRNPKMKE